jgi:SHC-transforming protein 1
LASFPEHLRPIAKPKTDQEYYNDLPGKIPPDLVNLKIEKSPKSDKKRERLSSNLIDLESPPIDHNYVNEKPVFDLESDFKVGSSKTFSDLPDTLSNEKWFHGIISRVFAESLLKNDGDFLVRESQNTRGQFVLTGMNFGQPKHLLLIDPEGKVHSCKIF